MTFITNHYGARCVTNPQFGGPDRQGPDVSKICPDKMAP